MSENITAQFSVSNISSWAQIISAIILAAAAWLTYFAANVHRKASTGSTMLACLEKYMDIMENRRKAVADNSVSLAEQYYREMFDLLWSEIHLWGDKVIHDETMFSWLYFRRTHYEDDDKIEITLSNGTKQEIKYKKEWDKYTTGHYFHPNDPYISLITKVHHGDIKTLRDLKKQRGRLNKPKYDEKI